jgi:uncharacterized protein (DUF2384 family)
VNDPFRKRGRKGPVLSQDEGKRQIRAVRAAQAALGSVEAVRDFLNSHNDSLEARPIDLAVASEAGLAAVEAAIAIEGRRRPAAHAQPSAKEARP